MKNAKTYLLETYMFLVIFFLILAFNHIALFNDFYYSCLFTVCFSILTGAFIIFINKIHFFSFPIIFLAVTFLYGCSTPLLYLFYGINAFSQWKFIDITETNKTLVFLNIVFASFYIGASLFKRKTLQESSKANGVFSERKLTPYQLATLQKIGFALLFMSFMFILVPTLQGKGLMYFIQSSYSTYHTDRKDGNVDLLYKLTFSNFIPWGLILIMLGSKNLKQFRFYIFFFVLPFVGIIFMTGDRSSAFPMLMLLFSIYYIRYHLTSKIPWGKIFFMGIIGVYLIPVIAVTRTIPIKDWDLELLVNIITFKENNFHSQASATGGLNPITSTLYVTSNSLQTFVGTAKLVPDKYPYRYGFDYFVRPEIVAIPFYDVFVDIQFNERSNSIWSAPSNWFNYIYSPNGTGLGYSQMAEAYFNFGPFGLTLFYIIAGFLLTKFWFNALSFNKLTFKEIAFWLLFFNNVINWIRNDSTGQIKFLTWAWFIVYAGFYIISYFKVKKVKQPIQFLPQ